LPKCNLWHPLVGIIGQGQVCGQLFHLSLLLGKRFSRARFLSFQG
jgi:hypothetical protein